MNTTIKVVDLERWTRIAEDTRKEIAFNKATGTWTWNNRGDLADHGPFKTYAEALYDAIEPYIGTDSEEAPSIAKALKFEQDLSELIDKIEFAPIKDLVYAAVVEYVRALGDGPHDHTEEKMIFDHLYDKLMKIMGPYHVAKKWKAVAEETMSHFDADGLADSIVDKLLKKTTGNLPKMGDMIAYLQIARIALDRDDVRDQLVEEMTLSDSEVTRLIEVLSKHLDI